MTTIDIDEQVRVIQKATKTASKNKASALKFLKDAGIIKSARKKAKTKK